MHISDQNLYLFFLNETSSKQSRLLLCKIKLLCVKNNANNSNNQKKREKKMFIIPVLLFISPKQNKHIQIKRSNLNALGIHFFFLML